VDSRDGPVSRVNLYAKVPGELKYLVICWQNANRMPTFNMAVQRLLETHPGLAQLAATLYTQGKVTDGLDTPTPPPINQGDSRT
jgi:hypothetical protein